MNRTQLKPQVEVDEDVERLAALVQRSGLKDHAIAAKVSAARHAKTSPETVANVRELSTRRPQNYTLKWIGWAIGYSREWRKM